MSDQTPVCAAPKLWWSGAAPLAKLAFTDLGSGTTGSLNGLSYLNLTKDYYPWPYVRSVQSTLQSYIKQPSIASIAQRCMGSAGTNGPALSMVG